MSNGRRSLAKLGGASWIVSGALFVAKGALDLWIGEPPSSGAEILAWRDANLGLSMVLSEVFVFATAFLVPAVLALHASLSPTHPASAAAGAGVYFAAIPVLFVLAVVHGRLVYPVHGLLVRAPDVAELVVALYVGGLHLVAILLGGATLVLGVAMRKAPFGPGVASLGVLAAVAQIVGSYPDAIGPGATFLTVVVSTGWSFAVGATLYRLPEPAPG